MNAEQIITAAIKEEMLKHQPAYGTHGCSCGLHYSTSRGAKKNMAWREFNEVHQAHVAQVVSARLVGQLKGVDVAA